MNLAICPLSECQAACHRRIAYGMVRIRQVYPVDPLCTSRITVVTEVRKLGHFKVSIAGEEETREALTRNDAKIDLHVGPHEHARDGV